MKISIDEMVINGNQFEAIVQLKGDILPYTGRASDITAQLEHVIIQNLLQKFLLENTQQILAGINKDNIINAIVLRSAQAISGDRRG